MLGLCIAELLFQDVSRPRPRANSRFASTSSSAPKAAPSVADANWSCISVHSHRRRREAGHRKTHAQHPGGCGRIASLQRIYLDSGLEGGARFRASKHWGEPGNPRRWCASAMPRRNCRNGRMRNSAWRPSYRVDDRSGPDHDPRFTVTVEVDRYVAPETGTSTVPSAPPSRWPRRRCWSAKASGRIERPQLRPASPGAQDARIRIFKKRTMAAISTWLAPRNTERVAWTRRPLPNGT